MSKYSEHSMNQKSNNDFSGDWRYKEGVFKTKNNKFIVRVRKGLRKTLTTISQFELYEDALIAYDEFYKNNPI